MQLSAQEPYRKGVANRLASSLAEAVARLPSKAAVAQSLCLSRFAAVHRIAGNAAEFLDGETLRYELRKSTIGMPPVTTPGAHAPAPPESGGDSGAPEPPLNG